MGHRRNPLITVITVVFNGAQELAATINSVASVICDRVEFLVIDGASTDGTVDVLRAHSATISRWVSEPDSGIYNAFNKGVRLARGEWILFLGAGDLLIEGTGLERALAELDTTGAEAQVAYGRVATFSAIGKFVEEENEPWDALRTKWQGGRRTMPHHQGVIQRRSFLQRHPFDESYKIVADYKAFMLAVRQGPPLYIDAVIAKVFVGGVSTSPRKSWAAVLEIIRLNRELGFGREHIVHQGFFLLKSAVKSLLSIVLPKRATMQIIDVYRVATRRRKKWT